MLSEVSGIIFDLDGTLYHMKWFMKPLLTCKVFPYCLRLPRFLKIRNTFAGKEMGSGELLQKAICDTLSQSENCSSSQIHQWITNSFYPAFVSIMPLFRGSRPGIIQTIDHLRKADFKLAVLSDFSSVEQRLEGLDILKSLFDSISSSESAGALKPSPKPFLSVAAEWDMPPEKILVVGDRDDTDGEAARAAGMRFLKIRENGSPPNGGLLWGELKGMLVSY